MALPLVAHAEQGTQGATVGTGEAGSGNPWDAVVGTPTITYASEHARGRMAYQVVAGGSAQQLVWTSTSVGTVAEMYGRFYLWSHAAPSAATGIVRFVTGGSQAARLRYNTDGTLTISDAGNAAEVTTSGAIPTGQLIRVGFRIQFAASGAAVELRTYNNPNSTTPTENQSATASGVGVNCDRVEIGSFNSATWAGCFDDIALSSTAEPGPVLSAPPMRLRRPTRALLVR